MERNLQKTGGTGCILCPRKCGCQREESRTGFCKMTNELYLARAALHHWEEPCLSGNRGSGAIFFSGCHLQCVYCQNSRIAKAEVGKKVSVERLAEIFQELQDKGAHNINLVTPSHYATPIREALELAKQQGLCLPVVYNCGGYERVETLRQLEGLITIYLPDMKYQSSELSGRYSHAPDYFSVAAKAVEEMVRQVGRPEFSEDGCMRRGVIVRHLVLPGHTRDSKNVIRYLYETYGNHIYISIMNQYTPLPHVKESFPELSRRVTKREYASVVDYAISLGVENGFIQEGETAEESFIPEFNYEGVERG